ncbi:stalk domain-containing protein [Cohnella faecalis]|uniref:Copper amine oxidase N-terminal domain-containing protein n=1 Tax=Cohnella faecalis TaxID=2315694 RepID=A0A398CUT3_9BACL|nr:stalk domain-containing protein [Cohnella faecalis]RIE02764.1 copper amine oxidase N-terminal domain-containing protein [Cohnella faecalis]
MRKRNYRKIGLWLSAALVLLLVGCQAIGGLNLDDMILKQLEVKSAEQSGKVEIELELNDKVVLAEAAEDPAAAKALELFKKMTFTVEHAAIDSKNRFQLKGAVNFGGKGDIPITLGMDEKAIRFDIAGAPEPIVLEIDSFSAQSLQGVLSDAGLPDIQSDDADLTEWSRSLLRTVGTYFVHHLPNPPKITVDRLAAPVNGTTTTLTKVHAELNGEELGDLIPAYLDNIVKDETGFKEMLRQFLKALYSLPPELVEQLGLEEPPTEAETEEAINAGVEELFPMLKEFQTNLADFRKEKEWGQIFDKGISLVTDLYVDDSLHVRKSNVDLTIAPAYFAEEDSPIRSIRIRSSFDIWNVNGDVTVPAVEVPSNALTEQELDAMQPYEYVRGLDEQSVLYDLLKNDLAIDDQSFEISDEWGIPWMADEQDNVYVPVRYSLEQFGNEPIVYTKKTKEIRFTDGATSQEIVLHIGSAAATVNGKPVTLKHAVFQDGPYAYISADDLFGLLHAEYSIAESDYGDFVLSVTRDL